MSEDPTFMTDDMKKAVDALMWERYAALRSLVTDLEWHKVSRLAWVCGYSDLESRAFWLVHFLPSTGSLCIYPRAGSIKIQKGG